MDAGAAVPSPQGRFAQSVVYGTQSNARRSMMNSGQSAFGQKTKCKSHFTKQKLKGTESQGVDVLNRLLRTLATSPVCFRYHPIRSQLLTEDQDKVVSRGSVQSRAGQAVTYPYTPAVTNPTKLPASVADSSPLSRLL
ncbi:hypothetical protein AAES_141102 [Amazona aestiva]|uniref:Uncharacterized protein n=1 Tax=Amazona aestiva TaxID=12930 RepID=A0A0Q3LZJ0_AMAAE|nr:hypothetical protein AAES_141102 [Amazona aestiva]